MLKKGAVIGVLASLAALGMVLVMSQVVSAQLPSGLKSALAIAQVTSPGQQEFDVSDGGSQAVAGADMYEGSSGNAAATANATSDATSSAYSEADSIINDDTSGTADATANATATDGSEAWAVAGSYLGNPYSDPVSISVAQASATNDGLALAMAGAGVEAGGTGNNTAYAFANSTGAVAGSRTIIETGTSTPAPGFYYDVYSSGDSFAFSCLLVPGPDNIIGFTYTNAGSTDAFADVEVDGSIITVIAGDDPLIIY